MREDLYVIDLKTESDTEDIYVNEIELATENEELYPIREITKRKLSNNNEGIFSEKEENYTSLDECLDDSIYTIRRTLAGRHKKIKATHANTPITFGKIKYGLGKPRLKTIRILFDSGASKSILFTKKDTKKFRLKKDSTTKWATIAGEITTTYRTKTTFCLPELDPSKIITKQMVVCTKPSTYDMIIGRDILEELGIDIKFSTHTIQWGEREIPMKDKDCGEKESYFVDDSKAGEESMERIKQILDAKYEPANLKEVTKGCTHLELKQRLQLYKLLEKYSILFDGTIGRWKNELYEIDLKAGAQPYHARPFPIPKIHEKTLRMEVERLVKIGVLKKINRSEWAAPTFIIPKKDGTVRFISDFREVNKRIKRKPYPIPNIQDLLLKLEGFQYGTSLDLNMGYYHIELSPDSKRICTIVLPWGKYEYQRLPMGLSNSPDIFQDKMSTLMAGLEFVRTYIDDLLVITKNTFEDF